MSQRDLQRLPPAEARKVLALAAVAVKARQKPVEPVAIVRLNGEGTGQTQFFMPNAMMEALVDRLIDRAREHGGWDGLEPLEIDVEDLRRDVELAAQAKVTEIDRWAASRK